MRWKLVGSVALRAHLALLSNVGRLAYALWRSVIHAHPYILAGNVFWLGDERLWVGHDKASDDGSDGNFGHTLQTGSHSQCERAEV